jgi:hypothetical protein
VIVHLFFTLAWNFVLSGYSKGRFSGNVSSGTRSRPNCSPIHWWFAISYNQYADVWADCDSNCTADTDWALANTKTATGSHPNA